MGKEGLRVPLTPWILYLCKHHCWPSADEPLKDQVCMHVGAPQGKNHQIRPLPSSECQPQSLLSLIPFGKTMGWGKGFILGLFACLFNYISPADMVSTTFPQIKKNLDSIFLRRNRPSQLVQFPEDGGGGFWKGSPFASLPPRGCNSLF